MFYAYKRLRDYHKRLKHDIFVAVFFFYITVVTDVESFSYSINNQNSISE